MEVLNLKKWPRERLTKSTMTDFELEKINAERRRKGFPPLSRSQAQSAVSAHPSRSDSGFNRENYLIGYTCVRIPSAATPGIIGAAMHPSLCHGTPSSDSSSYNNPSCNWEASSSLPSHDTGSSSSPSYVSGSSFGGSFDGGDGGNW